MTSKPSAIEKFSKIFSAIFNPMFSLLVYFIYHYYQKTNQQSFAEVILPILLWIIFPISFWIFWNVRKGNYTDADVSHQKQRNSLYYFINTLLLGYLLWDYFVQDNLDLPMVFLLILFILMMLSNYFIKSSMHTAFNLFAAALFFSINPLLGIAWLFITIVVAWTRIVLKRHSPREIFSGSAIALLVSFLYLYTHILLKDIS